MCGFEFSTFTCAFRSIQPIITATRRPMLAPIALKCSAICTTSYLVGAKTRPKKGVLLGIEKSVLCEKMLEHW